MIGRGLAVRAFIITSAASLIMLLSACDQLSAYFGTSPAQQGGVTVEPVATFALPNRSADGLLTFFVQRVTYLETDSESTETPQAGTSDVPLRRVQLQVVAANQGTEPVAISAESFRVRDAAFNFYAVVVPEVPGLPYLIGAEVLPAASLVGIVQADIPADAAFSALVLMWCLDADCQTSIEIPLALPADGS